MFEPWTILQDFLLAFSALFSIVNPPGSAFIFGQVTADRSHVERQALARQVAVYAAAVMLVALWGGVYVLRFFGITVDALRIAGGLVVAVRAWELLSQPERNEARKQGEVAETSNTDDLAFFPLTMPFTTGPGTISVAIALGSNVPGDVSRQVAYVIGASIAALAVAVLVWVSYRSADSLLDWLGVGRVRVPVPPFCLPAAVHRDADHPERRHDGAARHSTSLSRAVPGEGRATAFRRSI